MALCSVNMSGAVVQPSITIPVGEDDRLRPNDELQQISQLLNSF